MNRIMLMLVVCLFVIKLFADNKFDELQLLKKIDKEEEYIIIKQTFYVDNIFDLSMFSNKCINGFTISGNVRLESDSIMVKVILIDNIGSTVLLST
jgi:hypothetical protein